MDMYYQNETLYIEIAEGLTLEEYDLLKTKVFRVVKDYGVDRVVVQNDHHLFHNRFYLNQMKQDFSRNFGGDFLIK